MYEMYVRSYNISDFCKLLRFMIKFCLSPPVKYGIVILYRVPFAANALQSSPYY